MEVAHYDAHWVKQHFTHLLTLIASLSPHFDVKVTYQEAFAFAASFVMKFSIFDHLPSNQHKKVDDTRSCGTYFLYSTYFLVFHPTASSAKFGDT